MEFICVVCRDDFDSTASGPKAPITSPCCGREVCRECVVNFHVAKLEESKYRIKRFPCLICNQKDSFNIDKLPVPSQGLLWFIRNSVSADAPVGGETGHVEGREETSSSSSIASLSPGSTLVPSPSSPSSIRPPSVPLEQRRLQAFVSNASDDAATEVRTDNHRRDPSTRVGAAHVSSVSSSSAPPALDSSPSYSSTVLQESQADNHREDASELIDLTENADQLPSSPVVCNNKRSRTETEELENEMTSDLVRAVVSLGHSLGLCLSETADLDVIEVKRGKTNRKSAIDGLSSYHQGELMWASGVRGGRKFRLIRVCPGAAYVATETSATAAAADNHSQGSSPAAAATVTSPAAANTALPCVSVQNVDVLIQHMDARRANSEATATLVFQRVPSPENLDLN
mmetsp:Transcript_48852/g.98303  ORF Transcript_48852/g.98303 Transcript_48852/m.98303 type:complete len:401 (+) Transcript_48852:1-1203(+)